LNLSSQQLTAKEIRFRRRSQYAVLIAIGAVVSYLFLGEVVVLAFGDDDDGPDDGGDDGDDSGDGDDE
jgi:metaxin